MFKIQGIVQSIADETINSANGAFPKRTLVLYIPHEKYPQLLKFIFFNKAVGYCNVGQGMNVEIEFNLNGKEVTSKTTGAKNIYNELSGKSANPIQAAPQYAQQQAPQQQYAPQAPQQAQAPQYAQQAAPQYAPQQQAAPAPQYAQPAPVATPAPQYAQPVPVAAPAPVAPVAPVQQMGAPLPVQNQYPANQHAYQTAPAPLPTAPPQMVQQGQPAPIMNPGQVEDDLPF
jgi:hypothetical protein